MLIGDAAVGKTALRNQYMFHEVPQNLKPTIGAEFATEVVALSDEVKVKVQLWDTAGQEKYLAMVPAYCFPITNGKIDTIETLWAPWWCST